MKTCIMRNPKDLGFDDVEEEEEDEEGDAEHKDGEEDVEGPSSQVPTSDVNGASRCYALEQAYVHDVYAQIARECGACSPVRSHIKEFLFEEFEPGSMLMDIGCGDGKYLNLNPELFTIGLERCEDWFNKETNPSRNGSQSQSNDLLFGDLISIPIRDEFFDGVLCCGVLHHVATLERRIYALKEMGRILRVGGKLLITVWAFEGRELGSQDVLIKWNSCKPKPRKGNNSDSSGSDESDEDTTSSCSTTTANYVNRKAAYESCNSPTTEFGTCYSFVRRALQKFNLAPATFYHSSRRPSKCSTAKETATSTSGFATLEDMPIELRNIDENRGAFAQQSYVQMNNINNNNNNNNNNSTKSVSSSRRNSIINNPQNDVRRGSRESIKDHYGSLLSLIKDHILPKQSKAKPKIPEKPPKNGRLNGFLSHHRFSLPVVSGLRRNRDYEKFVPNVLNKDNNGINKDSFSESFSAISENKGNNSGAKISQEISEEIVSKASTEFEPSLSLRAKEMEREVLFKKYSCTLKREMWGKILQKSLSSDSLESKHSKQSRQQSTGTENTTATNSTSTSEGSARLVAYYSMPELRTGCPEDTSNNYLRCVRNRPKLTDLHPITFLEKSKHTKEVFRNDSQDTQVAIEEIENSIQLIENRQKDIYEKQRENATKLKEKLQLDLPLPMQALHVLQEEEVKDTKKTQRSLSVEYKPKISPSNRPQRRRFSASPSLHYPRTFVQFVQQESQHETHPSVDSEESFVTIIPANRSCRGSLDVGNDNDSDSFLDDVMMDLDQQSVASTTEDDALCENLSNQGEASDDNTSASSATTKSVVSPSSKTATPSPPANLHRYFHLFRGGELEELIESNVDNLHVVRSYYSEHATSWCVVAEKVQVWTI